MEVSCTAIQDHEYIVKLVNDKLLNSIYVYKHMLSVVYVIISFKFIMN
jgi:hypothetical protein